MKKLFGRNKGLNCGDVMEVLQSYLDGETDVETARKVAEHLGECEDCDLESKVYLDIKTSLVSRTDTVDPVVMSALQDFSNRLVHGEID